MRWGWSRLPPVLQRTPRDDAKWAFAVLVGVTLGYLVFGADDPSLLLGALIGVVIVIVALNLLRRMTPRRKP